MPEELTFEEEKALVEEIAKVVEDYFDDPYPPSIDGTDANGVTYKMFSKAMLSVIKSKYELKRKG